MDKVRWMRWIEWDGWIDDKPEESEVETVSQCCGLDAGCRNPDDSPDDQDLPETEIKHSQ